MKSYQILQIYKTIYWGLICDFDQILFNPIACKFLIYRNIENPKINYEYTIRLLMKFQRRYTELKYIADLVSTNKGGEAISTVFITLSFTTSLTSSLFRLNCVLMHTYWPWRNPRGVAGGEQSNLSWTISSHRSSIWTTRITQMTRWRSGARPSERSWRIAGGGSATPPISRSEPKPKSSSKNSVYVYSSPSLSPLF